MSAVQLNTQPSPSSLHEEQPPKIKIAYFIMAHRLSKQFRRLFNAIYHPNNIYLVNIDKKADQITKEQIGSFLSKFSGIHVLENQTVVWGGYSMVQAELSGMRYLLKQETQWDYFINLSGQDYPLKSQKIIGEFLAEHKGTSYLKYANQILTRPETLNRIENHFSEIDGAMSVTTHKRKYMDGVVPYIGGQWMMLTRDCCEFLCGSEEVKKFKEYYKNTLIPDESFFQTVLMNSSFKGTLVNDDMRAIIWIPDGDIKLRPKTFTNEDLGFLKKGNNLFARKFDDNVDANVIGGLKAYFDTPLRKEKELNTEGNRLMNTTQCN
ncbi:glycosyl transferase [Taibaiella sp. KBW10]|uniref:beta-1,6-N-acetylglucosaminyltransferase n=1 Tax=Taibaiella sp. KBW10 TaxID=2153357 RepID=UPI000F59EF50|nr:beta-1,6-N-acetylglucosaminyltransferase [Taibaiella sp. KBW10]RQO31009.1 glycosyl transferase [Taibaiella sp. KBW10]